MTFRTFIFHKNKSFIKKSMLGRKKKLFIPKHLYGVILKKLKFKKSMILQKMLFAMLHLLINKNKEREEKNTLISQFESLFLVIDQTKFPSTRYHREQLACRSG